MLIKSLVLCLLASVTASQLPPPPVDDDAKVASWIGEKVVILGETLKSPFKEIGGGLPGCYHRKGKPEDGLANSAYAAKTGTIVGLGSTSPFGGGKKVEIRLDGDGELIEACSESSLGFFTEREAVQQLTAPLTGKSLWVRGGELVLYEPGGDPTEGVGQIRLPNLSRVTLSRVDWGHPFGQITIYWRLADGREGGTGATGDPRFHRERTSGGRRTAWQPSSDFFLDEPRKLFPKWSDAIWGLIAKAQVAVGMTEEMVDITCGRWLRNRGLTVSVSANTVGKIVSCGYQEFVIEDGNVARFSK